MNISIFALLLSAVKENVVAELKGFGWFEKIGFVADKSTRLTFELKNNFNAIGLWFQILASYFDQAPVICSSILIVWIIELSFSNSSNNSLLIKIWSRREGQVGYDQSELSPIAISKSANR